MERIDNQSYSVQLQRTYRQNQFDRNWKRVCQKYEERNNVFGNFHTELSKSEILIPYKT